MKPTHPPQQEKPGEATAMRSPHTATRGKPRLTLLTTVLEITLVCAEGTDLPKVSKVESGRFPFSQGCKVLCPPVYILKGRDEVDKRDLRVSTESRVHNW